MSRTGTQGRAPLCDEVNLEANCFFASIGAFAGGNPEVRHDGVTLTSVSAGGPADRAGIKAGGVILAINDRYLFTVGELADEVSHHPPGTTILVRYRRYSTIYDASVVLG